MKDFVQAIDIIYLMRIMGDDEDAWKLAYQTDGEQDETRDYETTPTKDGTRKTPGDYEGTHSITSLLAVGDPKIKELQQQVRARNPKKLEVWEIDRTDINKKDVSTIPGDYSTDVITNVSKSAASEGAVEVTIETEVDGTIIPGEVTVDEKLKDILKQISEDQEFVQPLKK